MRLWKINDSELFKAVNEVYDRILKGSQANLQAWKDTVPFKWSNYYHRPANFNLCTGVYGVLPEEGETVPKGWRMSKDRGVVPDERTKEGKELAGRLAEQHFVSFEELLEAADIDGGGSMRGMAIPKVYRSGDGSELYIQAGENSSVETDPRYEEVTQSYVERRLREKAE